MIKRYDFHQGNRGYPCAVEWEDGEYVEYDDHASELATLRAENERLREALEKLYDDKGDMIAPNWVRLITKEALK